jgi:hypothetical protein
VVEVMVVVVVEEVVIKVHLMMFLDFLLLCLAKIIKIIFVYFSNICLFVENEYDESI